VVGARVPVIHADERGAGRAGAGLASLVAVAEVAVGARRAVGHGRMHAAVHGVTDVVGARVAVVGTDERAAGHAGAALTRLATVAAGGVGARRTVGHRRMHAAGDGVTDVVGARVAVVGADERRAGRAGAGLTRLGTVADVGVGARRAVGHGGVLTAQHGVT